VTVARRWIRAILSNAARQPLLREMQAGTRKGTLLGAALGLLLFLLLGALLGQLNRGLGGALIGAVSGSLGGVVVGSLVGAILGGRYFPQEGHVFLSIELDRENTCFAPGGSLTGTVRVRAEDTLRISGVRVYFVCRGFYIHDEIDETNTSRPTFVRKSCEYEVGQTELISARTIRRGVSQSRPFHFVLPLAALPSHHGYACSVRWTVHALLEAPGIPSVENHQEFLVESVPPVSLEVVDECQSVAASQVCQLVLSLPRGVYAEGETLIGHVHITCMREFEAEEVRAILLRIENVRASDNHFVYLVDEDPASGILRGQRRQGGQGTTYVWLEGEDNLSGPSTFRFPQTMTRLFSIPIPSHRRPTVLTEDGSVIWKVGVVVSRTGAKDVRVFHEIIVHTGSLRIKEGTCSDSADPLAKGPPQA